MLELIFLSGVDRDQTRPRVLISSGGEKLLNDLSGVTTCFCCHQTAKTSAIGGLTWAASTLCAATLLEIQQNSEYVALFSIMPWAATVWFNGERNTTGVYTIDRSVAAAHCVCWLSIILKSFHCQKWLLCFFCFLVVVYKHYSCFMWLPNYKRNHVFYQLDALNLMQRGRKCRGCVSLNLQLWLGVNRGSSEAVVNEMKLQTVMVNYIHASVSCFGFCTRILEPTTDNENQETKIGN